MRQVGTRPYDHPFDAQAEGRPRVAHLDRLKLALTGGVIVAHAAMSYGAAGTWIYQEDSLSRPTATALSVLVGGGVIFVLGLFFLIAGILTTGPLQRRGPRRFLLSRVGRLGLPVLAYALVVWPVLQWWIDRVRGDSSSLWTFYRLEFSAENWASRGTGPMWFVEILLVVTVGWCLWRWRVPARRPRLTPASTVLLTAGVIAVSTFAVRSRYGVDSAQFLDVHVWLWPQAASLFVLGAVGAERGWLSPVPAAVLRLSRWGVGAAVLLLVGAAFLSDGPEAFKGGWHWEAACLAGCEGAISVGVSLLALDWTRRHVVRQGRFERRLAGTAYGAFVAQGPVLVALALALRPLEAAGDIKFLLLATLGVAGSFLVGALARAGRATPRRGTPGQGVSVGRHPALVHGLARTGGGRVLRGGVRGHHGLHERRPQGAHERGGAHLGQR